MIYETVAIAAEAIAGVRKDATVMIGSFGRAELSVELIDALIENDASELTVVNNDAGDGGTVLAALIGKTRVRKTPCSFPPPTRFLGVRRAVSLGRNRTRARPSGKPCRADPRRRYRRFLFTDRRGNPLSDGKEIREIDGRRCALEYPIRADLALISALRADRWGNLVYRHIARNFGPIMATAAPTVVVQVDEILPLGDIDLETVVTPGPCVDRVVAVCSRRWVENGRFMGGVDVEGRPPKEGGAR